MAARTSGRNRRTKSAVISDILKQVPKSPNDTSEDKENTYRFIKKNIKGVDGQPTDAYGEIEFGYGSSTTAKYVKVAEDTPVEKLYELLTKHWKIQSPNLIISVTGGAKDFALSKRLKKVFRKSLIKASRDSGAWITTGGTHAGIMKHVGKAVKKYGAIRDDKREVVALGIASWGAIHGNKELEVSSDEAADTPKHYDAEEADANDAGKTILNSSHSHFILVDAKSDHANQSNVYGKEIKLRTKLEAHIANQMVNGRKVMIVCVIVQGGPGSLETVAGSIENETPVVAVEGSGGWADILIEASKVGADNIDEKWVESLMERNDMKMQKGENDETKTNINKWTAMLKTCISNSDLLTVFSLDTNDTSRDLDFAILEALLKAPNYLTNTSEQLKLAMAWNRSDIARSYILSDNNPQRQKKKDKIIKKKTIADIFFDALRSNKHKFCKVLLDYGVDLKMYFEQEKLNSFYKEIEESANKPTQERGVLCEELANLKHLSDVMLKVEKIMKKFMGRSYDSENVGSTTTANPSAGGPNIVNDPYHEIFRWAILANYLEIAKHVWEYYLLEPMSAAIMATKMLKAMAKRTRQNDEKSTQMLSEADEYEELAAGILSKCFSKSQEKAILLLNKPLPNWGMLTCLGAAIQANDKLFVSHPAVQIFLEKLWMHNLDEKASTLRILLSGICPLLILKPGFVLRSKVASGCVCRKQDESLNGMEMEVVGVEVEVEVEEVVEDPSESNSQGKPDNEETKWEKCKLFYDAPVVKFWMNMIFFLIYLALYSFIILSDFNINMPTISAFEWFLVGWTTTFLFEEIREIVSQEANDIMEKISLHIDDTWNVMDFASMLLFYTGLSLRFFENLLVYGLVFYSLAFMIQCVRIVHIFAVHHLLGPKIIMLGKMLKDLRFFLFILIVFLLAYGVASQALLYPTETSFGEIIVGIIYRPYWQIYGELFLDEINYNPDNGEYTCSDNSSNSLPRCPQQNAIVPIISAVYLLVSNVLLLNLLIAMFSYTFEKVQRQSRQIWKFQRYKLIDYYCSRSSLVPPLIVISHIVQLVKVVTSCRNNPDNSDENSALKQLRLPEWERWHADAYIRERHELDVTKSDIQLEKLNNKIDSIASTTEDLRARIKVLESRPRENKER